MDKFLIKTNACAKTPSALEAILQSSSSSSSSDASSTSDNNWSSYEQLNHSVKAAYKSNKPSKGWKMSNGLKSYVTYRNGQKVVATGRDAVILSKADSNKLNKKKVTTDHGLASVHK